ncbi:MAG TPA: baseplate J/gp47 family protein [Candidatus Scybalomonas excrementigallinarum]|nr:baseplate J/gp47 family protein [Candidatus Scybalomonas excrementigallinarum]
MAEYEFTNPDFVEGNSEEEIHERMMANLPANIDDMPGGFPYDFTMPTAIEKAELINFIAPRILMIMFPQFAWGDWLDLHGDGCGLKRREATKASGYVTLTGENGVEIAAGTVFCTPATDTNSSVEFESTELVVVSEGIAKVPISAVQTGIYSNVAAGSITLALKPITGIYSIINEFAVTGGTEEEEDDVFRERIMDANANKGTSYIGNVSDYRRWAMEVAGVGSVTIVPTPDGVGGKVKIIVVDANGQPANESILKEVYDHIMAPNDPLDRLAPAGASIEVVAPTTGNINYSANIALNEMGNIETVKTEFISSLAEYYEVAKKEGVLRYSRVYAILSNTTGVKDFNSLKIDGNTENLVIDKESFPFTGTVDFTTVEISAV